MYPCVPLQQAHVFRDSRFLVDEDELRLNRRTWKGYLHAGVRFLLGEIASQAQVRYPDVAVLVQEDIRRL